MVQGPYFFLVIFVVLIAIPCVGVGLLGYRMIDQLGRHPSKMPAIQRDVLVKLIVIEVLSLGLLVAVYWIFVNQ